MNKLLLSAAVAVASALSASAYNADNLYVVGSGCDAGWSPERALEMTKVTDNVFTWTGDLKANGEFKFIVARDWHPSITCAFETEQQGNTTVTGGNIYDLYVRPNDGVGKDNKFQVAANGNYTLSVDLNDMKMAAVLNQDVEVPVDLYIVGSGSPSGWDLDRAMQHKFVRGEDGLYSWSGQLTVNPEDGSSGCFRFLTEHDWWRNSYTTANEDGNLEVGLGEHALRFCPERPAKEVSFRIAATGLYTIVLDLKNLKMTLSEKPEYLFIMGNALNGGPGLWDLGWAQQCQPTGRPHEFKWEGQLYAKAEDGNPSQFKFLCQGNDWNPGFVSAEENKPISQGGTFSIVPTKDNPDWKFTVPEDGQYALQINTEAGTLEVLAYNTLADEVATDSQLTLDGNRLTVAAGSMAVYNACGQLVATGTAATLPAGLYIVNANGRTAKVAVK